MRKVYGYSHREIADMLDISIKTVENHVSTGLKRCIDEIDVIERAPRRGRAVVSFSRRHRDGP